MTNHEQNDSPLFRDEYPMPEDQLAYEMGLRRDFEARHPNAAFALHYDLQKIQAQAGMNVSRFDAADGPTRDGNMSLEFGAIERGEIGLMLHAPEGREHDHRISEYDVVGEPLPPETVDLLQGIYGLIGARIIRDDKREGETQGIVLRQGEYHGTPIYIEQSYSDRGGVDLDQPLMRAAILGSKTGPAKVDQLTASQASRLFAALGHGATAVTYNAFMQKNNITRNNAASVIGVLEAMNSTVDGQQPPTAG